MPVVLRLFIALCLMGLVAACGSAPEETSNSPSDTSSSTPVVATTPPDTMRETSNNDTSNIANNTHNDTLANAEAQAPADAQTVDMIAQVNGEPIARETYSRTLSRYMQSGSAQDVDTLRVQVLNELIDQQLIYQAAAEIGLSVSDDEVREEVDYLRSSMTSDEEWQQFLAMNRFTEQEMIDAQRDLLITQRVQDYLARTLRGNVPQVEARHILTETEAEARDVLQRLQNGEAFETVAAEVSIDRLTRDNGGYLGWFTVSELTDKRLAEIAFSLEQYQIAGPIQTGLGYHVIQTLNTENRPIEPGRLPTLIEIMFDNWLAAQREAATIERFVS